MKKKKTKDYELKDFVKSVDKVMQKQEKENPALKQVHARLSPDWNRVSQKISALLMQTDENEITRLREEVVAEGGISTRILIDLFFSLKQQAKY